MLLNFGDVKKTCSISFTFYFSEYSFTPFCSNSFMFFLMCTCHCLTCNIELHPPVSEFYLTCPGFLSPKSHFIFSATLIVVLAHVCVGVKDMWPSRYYV